MNNENNNRDEKEKGGSEMKKVKLVKSLMSPQGELLGFGRSYVYGEYSVVGKSSVEGGGVSSNGGYHIYSKANPVDSGRIEKHVDKLSEAREWLASREV